VPTDLYVCDLDGTLLGPDARLSEFAKNGLNRLLGAGVALTLASSRRTVSMRALLAGVELSLPVIELNGAFVSELESGRHLHSKLIPTPVATAAVEAIAATGADPVLAAWNGSDDRVYFGPHTNEAGSWYVDEKRAYGDSDLVVCENLLAVTRRERVAAITAFAPDGEAAALTGRLKELAGEDAIVYSASNYYCPGWTEVQVQHRERSAFGLFKRFRRTVPTSVPPWEASVWVSLKAAPEATGYLPPMWAKPTKTKHTKTANAITRPTTTPTMM
jgi:hydroxymethylpyrimidine pyrophosphatase-like HAD family hydrolase